MFWPFKRQPPPESPWRDSYLMEAEAHDKAVTKLKSLEWQHKALARKHVALEESQRALLKKLSYLHNEYRMGPEYTKCNGHPDPDPNSKYA